MTAIRRETLTHKWKEIWLENVWRFVSNIIVRAGKRLFDFFLPVLPLFLEQNQQRLFCSMKRHMRKKQKERFKRHKINIWNENFSNKESTAGSKLFFSSLLSSLVVCFREKLLPYEKRKTEWISFILKLHICWNHHTFLSWQFSDLQNSDKCWFKELKSQDPRQFFFLSTFP